MKSLCLFLSLSVATQAGALTLAEALARVDSGHPLLRTRTSLNALAEARAQGAAARPTPTVSLEFENALGTGELRGARSLETTLQFSRAIDWSTNRAARIEAANLLGDAERLEWEARRRQLLADAAKRFIHVVATQATLEAAHELAALSRDTVTTIETRAKQAVASPGDLARARLAFAEAELAAEHSEHEFLSARQNLASLWGAELPDFNDVSADFENLPAVADYAALAPRLNGNPSQMRALALIRWREAQEKLATANRDRGDVRWQAGARRVESTDDFGLVLGLSYAWPTTKAANAQAAEARHEKNWAAADGEAALNEARATLFSLCQELNHARIEHDVTRDKMVPAARDWLTSVETGASAGRYGTRDLLEARAALFNAQRRQAAAAADYHTTLVTIEQLIGGSATK